MLCGGYVLNTYALCYFYVLRPMHYVPNYMFIYSCMLRYDVCHDKYYIHNYESYPLIVAPSCTIITSHMNFVRLYDHGEGSSHVSYSKSKNHHAHVEGEPPSKK